jgi:Glu-tRNA(Gln) amidotransferase subunit E-like FAD-binding protein
MTKRRRGCITINQDIDVDIYMDDIIDNIDNFGVNDLKDLREIINREIDDTDTPIFVVDNLEDEQKIKILKEMFHKYSWSELEKISRSL